MEGGLYIIIIHLNKIMSTTRYTKQEKDYILSNCNRLTDAELVRNFKAAFNRDVSIRAVRKQRYRMGITKMNGRGVCDLRPS